MNTELTLPLNDVQAAEVLGLRPQTLRNMRCRGEGPAYVKLGRAVRYALEDLHAYTEARKIRPEQ